MLNVGLASLIEVAYLPRSAGVSRLGRAASLRSATAGHALGGVGAAGTTLQPGGKRSRGKRRSRRFHTDGTQTVFIACPPSQAAHQLNVLFAMMKCLHNRMR